MPKEEDGTVRYEVNLFAAAAAAAAELVRAGAAEFEEPAVRYARLLMECQQTEWPDWDEPIRGFFWRDRGHTLPSHFAHFSCEQYYTAGSGRARRGSAGARGLSALEACAEPVLRVRARRGGAHRAVVHAARGRVS